MESSFSCRSLASVTGCATCGFGNTHLTRATGYRGDGELPGRAEWVVPPARDKGGRGWGEARRWRARLPAEGSLTWAVIECSGANDPRDWSQAGGIRRVVWAGFCESAEEQDRCGAGGQEAGGCAWPPQATSGGGTPGGICGGLCRPSQPELTRACLSVLERETWGRPSWWQFPSFCPTVAGTVWTLAL